MSVKTRRRSVWIVQAVTISRVVAALVFTTTALIVEYKTIAASFFVYACLSDLLDGYLAKKLKCSTEAGRSLDLFADKFLTITCVLYAAARGLPLIPCTIIGLREVFLLSVRSIRLRGQGILPPQRVLGGLTVLPIWSITMVTLYSNIKNGDAQHYLPIVYWVLGSAVEMHNHRTRKL